MADGSRIALLGAVLTALISGLFAVYTTGQNTQLGKDKLDLQRELEIQRENTNKKSPDEYTNMLADQGRKEYLQRKKDHREGVKQATLELDGRYWMVFVRSGCDQPIQMAWNYEALDGQRITEGWFTVLPGKPAPTISTQNPEVYYYGRVGLPTNVKETPQQRGPHFQWNWTSSFLYFAGEHVAGNPGSDFESFLIPGRDWGSQTIELNCDSFTRRPRPYGE